MLKAVLDALSVRPGGIYLDLTCGRGGHSAAILDRGDEKTRVFAMDRDLTAVEYLQEKFATDARFLVRQGRFSAIEDFVQEQNIAGRVDGVLLDLGFSSPQIDDPLRGFSFMREGPLDMRMDQGSGQTLEDWLATVSRDELAKVIREYGEERWAKRIATAIDDQRQQGQITTTTQLAKLVEGAVLDPKRKKNPATRTFQALRIHINQELQELERVLPLLPSLLRSGGRIVVLSFHSLEDRIVKRFMAGLCQRAELPLDLPVRDWELGEASFKKIRVSKKAGAEEVAANPRSRSAILRVVEKVGATKQGLFQALDIEPMARCLLNMGAICYSGSRLKV